MSFRFEVCNYRFDIHGSRLEQLVQDIALRLDRYFGSEAQGWLNLQAAYDLRIAEKQSAKAIFKEIAPLALAC